MKEDWPGLVQTKLWAEEFGITTRACAKLRHYMATKMARQLGSRFAPVEQTWRAFVEELR